MAKSTKTKSKSEGEWRYKTIAEFKAGDTVAWRAQISIAPDGGKFAGIRKVITKKDGTQVVTRDGLTLKVESKAAMVKEVTELSKLMLALVGGDASSDSGGDFVLWHKEREVALTGRSPAKEGLCSSKREPKLFASAAEAKEYRTALVDGSAFKVVSKYKLPGTK